MKKFNILLIATVLIAAITYLFALRRCAQEGIKIERNEEIKSTPNIVTEVKKIGHIMGLPSDLVDKTPIDGLCGKTDEENLGFTYAELDIYIRTGKIDNEETKKRIDTLHERNLFKLQLMPSYKPDAEEF